MKVLVIGSGLLGLASAYALSRRGHEVTVLDRQAGPGRECSFANGALLTPGMAEPWNTPGCWRVLLGSIGRSDAALQLRLSALPGMATWGMAFLRHSTTAAFHRNWRSNLQLALYSLEAMNTLRQSTGIEYGRQTTGALKLFRNAGDLERADAALRQAPVDGMSICRLTAAETVSMESALASIAGQFAGALYYPSDEVGDAHVFCEQLAEHCRKRGVEVRYDVRVSRLERCGTRLAAVEAEGARIEADHYVFAAGSDTAPLLRAVGVKLPVQPVKGYTVTIDDGRVTPSLRIPVIDDAMHAAVVPLPGAIRAAGTAEFAGYDLTLRRERVDNLLKLVRAVLPEAPLDYATARPWCGLRPMTPDGMPIIGRTALDNVWVNTGHGHLGWTLAAGSGALLADLIGNRNPALDPAPFSPARF